jgi:DNA-binding NarL/FixJ family response regulator
MSTSPAPCALDGSGSLRVLLIDSHPIVRIGLWAIIESQPDLRVVAEADTLEESIAPVAAWSPDVAVIEYGCRAWEGQKAIAELTAAQPECRVIVYTGQPSRGGAETAMQAGASGYVLKCSPLVEVLRAIRVATCGGYYVDPTMASAILDESSADALTGREEPVLTMLAQGFSNKEIAARLDISLKTIEYHKTVGMRKAGIRSRIELIRFAAERGWFD